MSVPSGGQLISLYPDKTVTCLFSSWGPSGSSLGGCDDTRATGPEGPVKKSDREIMEILEAFDATGVAHSAAPLCDADPKTVRRYAQARDLVGLDCWIWPGRLTGLGSSLSDLLGCLPGRALPARLSDGASPARGVQGRRAHGAPARERGGAPPDQPGPMPAGWPAVVLGTVPADPPAPAGRGVRGDPGDAAGLAPATGHPQMGLLQPAASRSAVHGSRDPQARGPNGDGQSDVGAPARAG